MKISIVIPSFYPATVYGGTIFASLSTARIFASLSHQVYVSTTNTNMHGKLDVATGTFHLMENNIHVKYYNETVVDKVSLPLLFNIHKDIKNSDLIHIQAIFNTPIPVSLFWAKKLNKKVVLSPHGVLGDWIMNNGRGFKKGWLKFLIKPFANYVWWHATSDQEKKEILAHFPSAKVLVIPNALSLNEYKSYEKLSRQEFLKKYSKKEGKPEKIIISMGRLQKKKGFDILIHAFAKLKQTIPDTYLFIAGDDEGEKAGLENLAYALGLNDSVTFTGHLTGKDKIEFLGNADLFVLASYNENFGIVYAEALATGTPIIASTNTPWEEVAAADCGSWVPNTVEDTEKAMSELLKKEKNSEKAINFVERFSEVEVTKAWANAIQIVTE